MHFYNLIKIELNEFEISLRLKEYTLCYGNGFLTNGIMLVVALDGLFKIDEGWRGLRSGGVKSGRRRPTPTLILLVYQTGLVTNSIPILCSF